MAFQKTDDRSFLKIGGECQRLPEIHVLGAMEDYGLASQELITSYGFECAVSRILI